MGLREKFKLNLFRNGFLTEEFSLNIVQTAEKTELLTAGASVRAKKKTWRLPTLPHCCSTIGVRALDFRVRDGNGYFHSAMATRSAQMRKPEVFFPLRLLIWAFRILRDAINNMVKPFG